TASLLSASWRTSASEAPAPTSGVAVQQFPMSRTFPPYRVLQRLADEALVGNSRFGCRDPHRVEQLPGQAHVDSLAFGLKLEADRSHRGQVVLSQIGLFDKVLGFFIASEAWQFLFHSGPFPFCACTVR